MKSLKAAGLAVVVAMAAVGFFGTVGGLLTAAPVGGDDGGGKVGNFRTVNIVNAKGEKVITLTSVPGAHGIWVEGFAKNSTAGIVANDTPNMRVPYLMAFDYGDMGRKGAIGCQWAATVIDGEPSIQYAGKNRDFISYNPLRSELKPFKNAKIVEAGDDVKADLLPIAFRFPRGAAGD